MLNSCSPYLRLLDRNGIEWHSSLTKELAERAVREDKLIFQHIGYISNIKLREESQRLFSDNEVIKLLNENFICIAEDKEDRPESFLLALDLLFLNDDFSYGPMNLLIMPDRRPIICFSNSDPANFKEIIYSILKAKKEKKELLSQMADELSKRAVNTGVITKKCNGSNIGQQELTNYMLHWYKGMFDKDFIFHLRPFTPNPSSLYTVVEYLKCYPDMEISSSIESLLDHLQYSAIFDPVEGGFYRQCEDYTCKRALYEKTLEDNSQYIILYSAAYQHFGKESYRETALRTISFIKDVLSNGRGGYYSSSTLMTPESESDYYGYSIYELSLLFPQRYKEIALFLDMDLNIDRMKKQIPVRKGAQENVLTEDDLQLLKNRREEHRGHFIDKREITSYNSQFVKAVTLAATQLGRPELIATAQDTMEYLIINNSNDEGKLFRYVCCNRKRMLGYLSDYTNFMDAAMDLFKSTGDNMYMRIATRTLAVIMEHFYKQENGMFSKSEKSLQAETIPFKRESNIDIIRPSANSVMAGNLITYFELTGDKYYLSVARQQIDNIAPNLMASGPMLSSWAHKILRFNCINKVSETE
ncbi:MAG: DUF255 domain-containing protein [Bacteroidales bacterium]|nr:DUF255 domain-containing protein [Bacteroidales bacterium]MDD2425453.1 DUF255 domain-containing protein [Bacteroidales bacterium]MDD3988561.1 DUF255 domain-containing protein [Bacteroidales bacterium]MDD4638465.1 DUF255 domain-containing protein [Bacteroidales bacterium]